MSKLTKLKIVTPHAQVFESDIYSLEIKTQDVGRIAILPDHNPLVAPIDNHVAYIRKQASGLREPIIILEGIVYVEKHQIRVFSEYFIALKEVNLENIKAEITQLQTQYDQSQDDKNRMELKNKIKIKNAVLEAYNMR